MTPRLLVCGAKALERIAIPLLGMLLGVRHGCRLQGSPPVLRVYVCLEYGPCYREPYHYKIVWPYAVVKLTLHRTAKRAAPRRGCSVLC